MKNLFFFILTVGFIFSSCGEDPEPEPVGFVKFIDKLPGTYTGVLKELTCTDPQVVVSESSGSTTTIIKESETEINVSIVDGSEVFNFQAMINSDSTFVIFPYDQNGKIYEGTGKLKTRLRIVLGNDCPLLNDEIGTHIFE